MIPDDWLEVGTIARAHGIHGAVRLRLHNPESELLRPGLLLRLIGSNPPTLELTVASASLSGEYRIVSFEGVEDRTEAQKLTGRKVKVPRALLPSLQEGEYYQADLLGLEVVEATGRRVGRLEYIYSGAECDIWSIQTGRDDELLMPAREPYVLRIDLEARQIVVDKLEELTD